MKYLNIFRYQTAALWLASLGAVVGCASEDTDDDGSAGNGSGAVSGSTAGGSSGTGGSGGSAGAGATAGTSVAGNGGSESGGSAGTGGAAAGTGGTSGAPTEDVFGTITVNIEPTTEEDEGYTTILGRLLDGPIPAELELDSEEGDCQLLVPIRRFCEACSPPSVCTADDVCTAQPSPLTVGTLTVEGLGDETLVIEPVLNAYQAPALMNPPCAPGMPITASTDGFELSAGCIPELEVTGPDPIPVMNGEPVSLTWVPPETDVGSRIVIVLDVAHHGGKTGEVRCEVPDTGSFEIPASLVSALVSLGLAGFPGIDVTRTSVGTDPSGGEMSLVISSHVLRDADTGVVSCREDTDCPEGQACQANLACG